MTPIRMGHGAARTAFPGGPIPCACSCSPTTGRWMRRAMRWPPHHHHGLAAPRSTEKPKRIPGCQPPRLPSYGEQRHDQHRCGEAVHALLHHDAVDGQPRVVGQEGLSCTGTRDERLQTHHRTCIPSHKGPWPTPSPPLVPHMRCTRRHSPQQHTETSHFPLRFILHCTFCPFNYSPSPFRRCHPSQEPPTWLLPS